MTTPVLGFELRPDGFELFRLKGFDLDPSPALRGAGERGVHQLQHGALADGVRQPFVDGPVASAYGSSAVTVAGCGGDSRSPAFGVVVTRYLAVMERHGGKR